MLEDGVGLAVYVFTSQLDCVFGEVQWTRVGVRSTLMVHLA